MGCETKESLLTSVLQISVVKLNHEIPAITFYIYFSCYALMNLWKNSICEIPPTWKGISAIKWVKPTSSTVEKGWQSMAIISTILWWMRFAWGSLISQRSGTTVYSYKYYMLLPLVYLLVCPFVPRIAGILPCVYSSDGIQGCWY